MKPDKKTPDRYFSNVLMVTIMTISRWRRGVTPAPDNIRKLARYLHSDGKLSHIPDWLKDEA